MIRIFGVLFSFFMSEIDLHSLLVLYKLFYGSFYRLLMVLY